MKTSGALFYFCCVLFLCGITHGSKGHASSPVFAFQGPLVEVLGTQAAGQSLQSGQNARPTAVQAEKGDAAQKTDAAADSASTASAFEVRYLISYFAMLIFIGGGTFLVVRPTGRISQDAKANDTKEKDKKKQKK